MKKWSLLTAAVLSVGLILSGCSGSPAEYGSGGGASGEAAAGDNALVVAIQSDPSGLDPHMVLSLIHI